MTDGENEAHEPREVGRARETFLERRSTGLGPFAHLGERRLPRHASECVTRAEISTWVSEGAGQSETSFDPLLFLSFFSWFVCSRVSSDGGRKETKLSVVREK